MPEPVFALLPIRANVESLCREYHSHHCTVYGVRAPRLYYEPRVATESTTCDGVQRTMCRLCQCWLQCSKQTLHRRWWWWWWWSQEQERRQWQLQLHLSVAPRNEPTTTTVATAATAAKWW